MGRSFTAASDLGGEGSVLNVEGTFQVQATQSADQQSTKGNQMNGCSAVLSVLAGTAEGQVGKEFHLHLFDPDLSKEASKQEWAIKKQTAYGVAINQIDPADLGKAGLDVDFGAGVGHQFFITLENNTYNGKTELQLKFANIYHVDDPRAKGFPRDEEAIKVIPEQFRKKAEYFEPLQSTKKPKGKETRLSEDAIASL